MWICIAAPCLNTQPARCWGWLTTESCYVTRRIMFLAMYFTWRWQCWGDLPGLRIYASLEHVVFSCPRNLPHPEDMGGVPYQFLVEKVAWCLLLVDKFYWESWHFHTLTWEMTQITWQIALSQIHGRVPETFTQHTTQSHSDLFKYNCKKMFT